MRDGWMKALREKSFRSWLHSDLPLKAKAVAMAPPTGHFSYDIEFNNPFNISFSFTGMTVESRNESLRNCRLEIATQWNHRPNTATIYPRGTRDSAWDPTEKKQTQHRRRFMLLGQTLESQQINDVRRAIQALHIAPQLKETKITLVAERPMAGVAIYVALFEPSVIRIELRDPPTSHMPSGDDPNSFGPPMLNVLRYLDMPQAVAMAAERATVVIQTEEPAAWEYPVAVAKSLGWKGRVEIKAPTK
jgi:hypothetical protein